MWISWLGVKNSLNFINVIYTGYKYFIKCMKITYIYVFVCLYIYIYIYITVVESHKLWRYDVEKLNDLQHHRG